MPITMTLVIFMLKAISLKKEKISSLSKRLFMRLKELIHSCSIITPNGTVSKNVYN